MTHRLALLAAWVALAPQVARADEPAPSAPPAPDAPRAGSALATATAVVPGIFLPGVGHFVLGEREAGFHFLEMDAVGLALMGVGFGGMALSGGSDRVAPECMAAAVGGMSLLIVGWVADIAGSAHGSEPWPMPRDPNSSLSVDAGYTGLFGSRLDLHNSLDLGATGRLGIFSVHPWGMLDPSMSFYGAGSRFAWIVWQDRDDPVTRISVVTSVTHYRFRPDRYSTTVGELHGELRFNLRYLSRTLNNAYLLARVGAGAELFAYDATSLSASDLTSLMVLEFGGGAQVARRVNLEFIYSTRKDELPGGLVIPGIFDSYLGFLEGQARVTLTNRFAVIAGLRWGNGLMPWISVESQLF